jgi:hypothetical protein
MSAINRVRATAFYAVEKKPFCKVCHDARKPESVFTSHFVRSAPGTNGKVVCPTLLSMECRYCYQSGHTVKFCTVLEKNKKQDAKARSTVNKPVQKEVQKEAKPKNVFAALNMSDDESDMDEEIKVSNNVVDDFPVLGGGGQAACEVKKDTEFSYAKALATVASVEIKPKPVVVSTVPVPAFKKTWTSWADCESSDEEDDEIVSVVRTKNVVYDDNSSW